MSINCGIYVMYFECDDGQYYVGKSMHMDERYYDHCRKLKSGSHINKAMLTSYLKYGNPTMVPIEEVLDTTKQSEREIYWIKTLDTFHNGMNGTIGGDDLGYGADAPSALYDRETYIKILEQLANTSDSLRQISNKLSVSYGVVQKISNGSEHAWLHSEYPELYAIVRSKCGSRKGLVYGKDTYVQAMLLGMDARNTIQYIRDETGLNLSVVKNILYGINHLHLKNEFPEEYAIMLSNKGKRLKGATKSETYPDVLSPEGEVFKVTNASQFAKTMNLQIPNFHRLLTGRALSYKGWTLA